MAPKRMFDAPTELRRDQPGVVGARLTAPGPGESLAVTHCRSTEIASVRRGSRSIPSSLEKLAERPQVEVEIVLVEAELDP